ncbi:NAD-dependent deacetylase [Chloroflexota bacterium]
MKESINQAARDLSDSKWAIALAGAGMSTESGIPDIRGPHGIGEEYNRQALRLHYQRFLEDPKAWWEERLSPGSIMQQLTEFRKRGQPNPGHYALAELEDMGMLKCVITQSFDRLHQRAGSRKVIEIYGNDLELRCMSCGLMVERESISLEKLPPHCKCGGVMKTAIIAFGQPIPADILKESYTQATTCDLMLVCGTSLVIYPAAELPQVARYRSPNVKLVEINMEPLDKRIFDYTIIGKTGEVLPEIVAAVKEIKSNKR